MRILFINHHGGGFADYIDLQPHTTVQQLFADQVSHGDPDDYLIRVNRQPATRDQDLRDGDRVTFTPVKIDGAAAGC